MKKLIAMVLAVAMVLSMVCFASAVGFTDDGQIDISNKEAVTVLSEMGIIAGMGDGTFAPNATLTRAQAAKIICYMLLGKDGAEALPAAAAKFSDVPTSHWSCKYVNYCADKGIVAGIGSGKFGPNNKLTGYAFGKMLLCGALGFDAEKEGLVGADWDANTSAKLRETKLNAGTTVTSKDLNRQNACHLALNALFYGEDENPEETLAFKVFTMTRMGGILDKDNQSRPTVVYNTEKSGVCWEGTDLAVGASPILVMQGKASCAAIAKALGDDLSSANCGCYRNGVMGKAETFDKTPITPDSDKTLVCSGDGVTTEFYYDAAVKQYTCIMTTLFAAEIVDATEADVSASGKVLAPGSVTLNVGGSPMVCVSNNFTKADVGGYALFAFQGNTSWSNVKSIVSAVKAKTVSGILTSEDESVKVGGKTYTTNIVDAAMQGNAPIPYTAVDYLAAGGAVGDTVTLITSDAGMVYGIVKG